MTLRILKSLVTLSVFIAMPSLVIASEISTSVDMAKVSKSLDTPFGLYSTPSDAHKALTNNPSIFLIDVRDPIEISFVGHPTPMDANIPLRTVTKSFDTKSGRYKMNDNPGFVGDVDALMERSDPSKSDPIIVTCRSGPRSAVAARLLHATGYTNVWNQVEGFEGSFDSKTGARSKNGWRNSGLPWKYQISSGTHWQPKTGE